MQSVKEIEKKITQLSPADLSKFREWFENFDADSWDRQFENDSKTGALDAIVKDAIEEYGKGRTTEL